MLDILKDLHEVLWLFAIVGIFMFLLHKARKEFDANIKKIEEENKKLREIIGVMKENFDKLLSQKKSSEVRVGHIAEKVSPFLKGFPMDPQKVHFLGNPIDYIGFDENGVSLIEVKSGKSRLSKVQRDIRDAVKAKKITWHEFRIDGEELIEIDTEEEENGKEE